MNNKEYILFIILNEVNKTREIVKRFKKIGIARYTLINTFGSKSIYSQESFEPIIAGTKSSSIDHMRRTYNKTFFVVLKSEEEVFRVMDEVERILYTDQKKTGKGIMFSVPIISSMGIRKQNVKM